MTIAREADVDDKLRERVANDGEADVDGHGGSHKTVIVEYCHGNRPFTVSGTRRFGGATV